jgi:hypothetical protein
LEESLSDVIQTREIVLSNKMDQLKTILEGRTELQKKAELLKKK